MGETPDSSCDQQKRRTALKVGGAVALGGVLAAGSWTAGKIFASLMGIGRQRDPDPVPPPSSPPLVSEAAKDDFADHQAVFERLIPEGVLLPEDERTGGNVMLSVNPDYLGCSRCFDFIEGAATQWTPILSALPNGTNVGLLVPNDAPQACQSELAHKFPDLRFSLYTMPVSTLSFQQRSAYAQDIIFATGTRDANGRFVLIGNQFDPHLLELRSKGREEGISVNEDGSEVKIGVNALDTAVRLLGDNFLVQSYDDKFAMQQVPLYTEGGDMQIARLRNGKIALIVGLGSIAHSILGLLYVSDRSKAERLFKPIEANEFMEQYATIKLGYAQMFGVEEVIVPGEFAFLKRTRRDGKVELGEVVYGSSFFHTDMIVKPATDAVNPENKLAFCTDLPHKNGVAQGTKALVGDPYYLEIVQAQMQQSGFEVVELPCGPYPAMNYANSLMYTGEEGKVVLLPQYGIPQDEAAARIYAGRGFVVKKVDFSYMNGISGDDLKNSGSLHCRAVVLD